MTADQATLWEKIRNYSFDAPTATYTFVARLVKENGWDRDRAERAIEEYRRFAFLATAAGHPVSPSDAIDQVWHQHLLYTKTYWDEFCEKTLGRPLHHEPSDGRAGQAGQFDDWYRRTLDRYREFFGDPPADLWPQGLAKLGAAERYCRIDIAGHWLLPRRRVLAVAQAVAVAGLLTALVLFVAGCQSTSVEPTNPMDMRGPSFLRFYAAAFVSALAVVTLARLIVRESSGPNHKGGEPGTLDPFEIAYLAGGERRVAEAAVASLYQRGLIEPHAGRFRRVRGGAVPAGATLHPVERAVWRSAAPNGRATLARLRQDNRSTLEACGDKLRDAGWVINTAQARWLPWASVVAMLIVPLLGVMKIFVGVSRGKPVGFLLLACIASLIVTFLIARRLPLRTRRGDAALSNLRRNSDPTQTGRGTPPDMIAFAVAIGGVGALGGLEWTTLRSTLQPTGQSGGWSGDGGSSCGGTSSCGGGGCGGGCGGCGG